MKKVSLKPGREKSLLRRHPWVFSGAVARVEPGAGPGDTVQVRSAEGKALAVGAYSPASQLAVRVWAFEPDAAIDAAFFRAAVGRAVDARQALLGSPLPDMCRLINGESDGLPGVIVDRYGDVTVCQFLSAGAERWREEIAAALAERVAPACLYERSDPDVRAKEGLPERRGVLLGRAEPPPLQEVSEGELRFLVDVREGHKTGFYIDQRDNRGVAAALAPGREVLDCFSYTGGFALAVCKAGAARVTCVESAAPAVALARRHMALNRIPEERVEFVEQDVFRALRRFRDAAREFDLIVLDPPKFAESRAQVPSASRGYKDINLLAFKLLRPGGLLCTFSCSAHMTPDLFQKIVADAALDARRDAQIVRRLSQAADHPVALGFPEGHYLKGLVCRGS